MSIEIKKKKENTSKGWWELKVKTRATKSWLVLVFHLIGWESGASFLVQSQSRITFGAQLKINT